MRLRSFRRCRVALRLLSWSSWVLQYTKISSLMFIVPGMPSSASLIMFWNTLAADVTPKLRPTSYPGSYLRSPPRPHARCEKTLAAAGHVAHRFWELTKKSIGGRTYLRKIYFHFLCKVLHFRNREHEMETVPLLTCVFIESIRLQSAR